MSSDDPKGYEVGKGKPPDTHKFKPGQSGNPGGRPKGSKSWQTVFKNELFSEIGLKEQGKELKVTKLEAFAKRLVSDALSGNPKALGELLRQINLHVSDQMGAEAKDLPAAEDDVRLLLKYAAKAVAAEMNEGGQDELSDKF